MRIADAFVRAARGYSAPWPEYADRPSDFGREILGIRSFTAGQELIGRSVVVSRETNVAAAHGVGKTLYAAVLALWWVFCRGGMVVTTAPTNRQVKELLWGEIRRLYDRVRLRLGGTRGSMHLRLNEHARAIGFKAADYRGEMASGFHHPLLLAIADEAGGILSPLDDEIQGWTSGADNRLLRIGNPVTPGTPFERACKLKGCIRITAFEHPNTQHAYGPDRRLLPEIEQAIVRVSDTGAREVLPREQWPQQIVDHLELGVDRADPYPGATSIEWIEGTARDKGESGPYWLSRVLALFPSSSADSLIPAEWFEAARVRFDADPAGWIERSKDYHWQLGVDVGESSDPHALCWRRGPVIYGLEEIDVVGDTMDNRRCAQAAYHRGVRLQDPRLRVQIDQVGIGAGTLAALKHRVRRERLEWRVVGISGGRSKRLPKAKRKTHANLKAVMYDHLREAHRAGTIAIAPLPARVEDRLRAEGAAVRYSIDEATDKLRIEKKAATIERLGWSPNLLDAESYAYYVYSGSDHGSKRPARGRRSARTIKRK